MTYHWKERRERRMNSPTVSSKLQWIAAQAVREPARVFISLAHLIDIEFLKEAFRRTRKDGAPGVDEVTAKEYAEHLEENLHNLHERLRTGRYKAPPVKRVWLDKDDGEKRPIGMPAFVKPSAFKAKTQATTGSSRYRSGQAHGNSLNRPAVNHRSTQS